MYKNKIKNRLQKISSEVKDITFRNKLKGNENDETVVFTSIRKHKLSLSKDITAKSEEKQEVSQQKLKRKYLKVVSKEKYVRNPSPPFQKEQMEISKSQFHRDQLKQGSFVDGLDDNNKGNTTKSTVTITQQIVPILLINQDTQQDSKTNNSYIYKTPLRRLKSNQRQNYQTSSIINKSGSAGYYKNKHRINLSPNPIKQIPHCKSNKQLKEQSSFNSLIQHSKSLMLYQTNQSQVCQLTKKLNQIHLKRKAIQERISSQLDIISQKSGLSQTNSNTQPPQTIKQSKILFSSNIVTLDINPSSKIKHKRYQIKQKDKNLRNMIMNRIYS